jgi:dihydropteroate synthase
VPVSVDTRAAAVACRALDAGAVAINDVSAGRHDPGLLPLVAKRGATAILMHMQGEPNTMQEDPRYRNCTDEVRRFLLERTACAEAIGVPRNRIWIDPGIGFGKTVDHNLELLGHLDRFVATGYQVLLGVSRKSFIDRLFSAPVGERLGGSLAALVPALRAGVHAVRVHDVKATYQFLELVARLE